MDKKRASEVKGTIREGTLWKRKMQSLENRLQKGQKRRDSSGSPMRRGFKKKPQK